MSERPHSEQAWFEEQVELLGALLNYYAPHEALMWLASEHPQLMGQRPVDVLVAGRKDDVWAIIARLESGAYL